MIDELTADIEPAELRSRARHAGVRVFVKRLIHNVADGRRVHARLTWVIGGREMRPFIVRPAVIAAFAEDFDFLPLVLADIAYPNLATRGIDGKPPGMAKTYGIKFATQRVRVDRCAIQAGHIKEGIVRRQAVKGVAAGIGGDTSVSGWFEAARAFVDINP